MQSVARLPGITAYRKRKYRRRFEREGRHNLFWGCFGNFEEARRNAPANRPLGYDNSGAAGMYDDRLSSIPPNHYPMLFWLSKCWKDVQDVLDYGGHRGTLFYSCSRLFGSTPLWTVFDVPAVVAEGRRVARERGAATLSFESDLSSIASADTLVAAGSLQYVEDSATQWLASIPGQPRRILINATPFHATREFVTLNNMGPAYCPYKVRRAGDFFRELGEVGFEVVDTWTAPEKFCHPPFTSIGPFDVVYRGAYLVRR